MTTRYQSTLTRRHHDKTTRHKKFKDKKTPTQTQVEERELQTTRIFILTLRITYKAFISEYSPQVMVSGMFFHREEGTHPVDDPRHPGTHNTTLLSVLFFFHLVFDTQNLKKLI